jgi:predicted DNA-binding transcriptional regulator YafY
MNTEKEYGKTVRCLRILSLIASYPYHYTCKELGEKFDVSKDTIKRDLEAITNARFTIKYDKQHRCGLLVDKQLTELQSLLIFSKNEEDVLLACLKKGDLHSPMIEKLTKKLHLIFHAAKLNHASNRSFVSKMDILEKAKNERKVVILKDYHSTSSSTKSDRKVEAFHLKIEEDIIHCFDLDKKGIRHFRISRVLGVETLEETWQYDNHHSIVSTDCFRIQDNKQEQVYLLLQVGGYNELLERFPNTRNHLKPCVDNEQLYEFSAMVNWEFYGLTNFILGYSKDVVEIRPHRLVEHIRKKAQEIFEKRNW